MKQFDAEISVQKRHHFSLTRHKIYRNPQSIQSYKHKHIFVRHHSDSIHNYSDVDIKAMFEVPHWQYLCSFWESGLPTVCCNSHGHTLYSLVRWPVFYDNEAVFVQDLLHEKKNSLAVTFNFTYWRRIIHK